jgi:C1A family cysteine protease
MIAILVALTCVAIVGGIDILKSRNINPFLFRRNKMSEKRIKVIPFSHNRVLNWKPGFKSHRKVPHSLEAMDLPSNVDLRDQCSPVLDQGQVGSCSGNAAAGLFDFGDTRGASLSSRLFIYWHERFLEGDTSTDAGATTLADACHTMIDKGVALEDPFWPYDPSKVLVCPTSQAFGNATKRKISSFSELEEFNDLQLCLANGKPFMFGIPVYQSFMEAQDGQIPMPDPDNGDQILGGHALACVGYDDGSQCFIFKNSWGTSWGDNGFGYLPYDYMCQLADDFFCITKGK